MNTVTGIEQILNTLELPRELVKVSCANRRRNRRILNGRYKIEPVTNPNKKLNFFTKKGFQGCNLFTNNGLIIVVSDGHRQTSLIDISTTMEQIAGRLRENEMFHNVFRNYLIHIYSTNDNIPDDKVFEEIMNQKHRDAEMLKEMTKNYTHEQMYLFEQRTNLENDIVSIIDSKLVFNPLKEQSFRYKQQLRNQYRNDINIASGYRSSDRFSHADH